MGIYRSETVTITPGTTRTFDLNFLPETEKGDRNVIDDIQVDLQATFTTSTTCSILGENLASLLRRFRLRDADGDIYNISGMKTRLMNRLEYGDFCWADTADVGTDVTVTARLLRFWYPFKFRNMLSPEDTSLPVDVLRNGGGVEITAPSVAEVGCTNVASGFGSANSGLTLTTLSYTLNVFTHREHDVQIKTRFEYRDIASQSATDLYYPINGGLLRYALFHTDDNIATGGADLSNVTNINCEALNQVSIEQTVLNHGLFMEHQLSENKNDDPFRTANPNAQIVFYPKKNQHMPDLPYIPGSMYVRLDGTALAAAPDLLYCALTQRTERSQRAVVARFGNRPDVTVTIKTEGKTMKDPNAWSPLMRSILPAKVG